MKTRISRTIVLTGLALLVCSAVAAAQRPESATSKLFPDPARVLADYADDPSRWAALTALYFAAGERGPDGQYKASYDKSSAYQQAIGVIEARHHVLTPQEEKDFVAKIQALRRDRAFTQQVLDRYGLAKLPTGPPRPSGGPPPPPPGPQGSYEVELQKAVPYWIATIVVMWLVVRQLLSLPVSYPVPPAPAGGAITLPESLRVVEVPGVRYPLEMDSGLVTEEKTWTETTYSTYATPGSVQTVGDTVYTFPGRQETVASSVQKDRIWLRDVGGHESSWTITGGTFDVRAGHVVSRVGTREGDKVQFMVACNHVTGQFVVFPGTVGRYHGSPNRSSSRIALLIGVVGWVYGGWNLIPLLGQDSFAENLVGFTIMGLIGSFLIALFVNGRIHGKIFKMRNAYFSQKYLPELRQFLLQQSPAVIARFPTTPAHH